jgi:hypothetical protein
MSWTGVCSTATCTGGQALAAAAAAAAAAAVLLSAVFSASGCAVPATELCAIVTLAMAPDAFKRGVMLQCSAWCLCVQCYANSCMQML